MPETRGPDAPHKISLLLSATYEQFIDLEPYLIGGVALPDDIREAVIARRDEESPLGQPLMTIEMAEEMAAASKERFTLGDIPTSENELWWTEETIASDLGGLFEREVTDGYRFSEVIRVFDTTLSKRGLQRVVRNARQRFMALPEQLRSQEQEYLATLPEIDPTQPVNLFEGIVINEGEELLTFSVPPRVIRSERCGDLVIGVRGKQNKPKNHADFGNLRFSVSGNAFWFPDTFVGESVDPETLIPDIIDRERSKFEIIIGNPYHSHNDNLEESRLTLVTSQGDIDLKPDVEDLMMAQGQNSWIFYNSGLNPLQTGDFLRIHDIDHDDVDDMLRSAERSKSEHNVWGDLWIPVDMLRSAQPMMYLVSDDLGLSKRPNF